jgi:hypothetical protein
MSRWLSATKLKSNGSEPTLLSPVGLLTSGAVSLYWYYLSPTKITRLLVSIIAFKNILIVDALNLSITNSALSTSSTGCLLIDFDINAISDNTVPSPAGMYLNMTFESSLYSE